MKFFFDEIECESLFFMLWWIMLAKVFMKTPVPFYVKCDVADSQTFAEDWFPEKFEEFIAAQIEMFRLMDKLFNKVKFFKNNPVAQYAAKSLVSFNRDKFDVMHRGIYKNGVTGEILSGTEKIFKKYFGKDYFYPMFLFNMAHTLPFERMPY